jgi:hypothetical protein
LLTRAYPISRANRAREDGKLRGWSPLNANEKELGIGRPYLDKDPPHELT